MRLDKCSVCKGIKGGVPGNENLINGVLVCDYCHGDGAYKKTLKIGDNYDPNIEDPRFMEMWDEIRKAGTLYGWIGVGLSAWRAAVALNATEKYPEWMTKLRKELLLSKVTHTFTFTRDEVMQLMNISHPASIRRDSREIPEND